MPRLENNMWESFKSTEEKAKVLIHRARWKETLVFFCFVLLSFGFWMLQSLQQEYEIEMTIPIRYKNVPDNIAFQDTIPQQVTIRIKDKGSVLLNYQLGQRFLPIDVNLKRAAEHPNGKEQLTPKSLENEVTKQLMATTQLMEITPTQIELRYSQRKEKQVPVVFQGEIETLPGFQVSDEIHLEPSSVTVYASQATLDTIHEVKTAKFDIRKGGKTFKRTLQLQPIAGANLAPNTVSVTIPIEEYADKTLEIPVQCMHVPEHYTVRMFPTHVKVNCSVPLSRFKELSEELFTIQVDFSELEQNTTGTEPVELVSKPEWVHSPHLIPGQIEFIIEQHQ